ncbi:rhamnulokinase [Lederbergia galactosidilytica]|uniref:Rhamnulokinase n=1 Tax=Lederbergia galactosidilytica TaxID=217031 RepID=A0A178A144_9BACI|nr:rhamnulokinase [Lederbergia galactosidilytica]KRG13163.1 rhamnulokinase [Virgibacillus soli]OAK73539.1 rhamnulokinase [Lederbergia galactosidilytica]
MIDCLAVDIGASSGRVILGSLQNDRIDLEEIHRFENGMVEKNGQFCWELNRLFEEIKIGIKKCRDLAVQPVSIGIDTWAVDFVLLDEQDQLLTEAVAYRDPRTNGIMEEVDEIISREDLYAKTGIQFLTFNTIYQLYSLKKNHPEILRKAKSFLLIPDYLHFLLTGKKVNEYTNATTTQLVNASTKEWDQDIITKLGFPLEMFQEIQKPKTNLGGLKKELNEEFGFDMEVILPATHDTGSAVIAVPEVEPTIYLSSGTWSLMGVENHFPICSPKALSYNFTNEGGIDGRFRVLKNIMGLWILQEIRRNFENRYSFAELAELAKTSGINSIIDVEDDRFLKPDHMVEEIQAYCQETKQTIPETPGEIAKCIFISLAERYKQVALELEKLFGNTYQKINIIGGGAQNAYLNQLVADGTKKEVHVGPVEATTIGNLVAQYIALGGIENIDQARTIIKDSFTVDKYSPKSNEEVESYEC